MHILLYPYLGVPFSWDPGQIGRKKRIFVVKTTILLIRSTHS